MAAGATYTPIATTTLGSAQTSVTFSSISGSYTDLVLVMSGNQASNSSTNIEFNGDSGTNYSETIISGNGSAAQSARITNDTKINTDYNGSFPSTANNFGTQIVHIMNYSNTTTYKTVLSRANAANSGVDGIVGLWRSTAAINSIKIKIGNGTVNINSGSTFTLYGIVAA